MRCIAFDRPVDTDRPIPGALAGEGEGESIRVRWHAATAPAERPVWTRAPDALWFDPPGVARYRCTPTEIAVAPVAGADPAHVDALLVATALPAVMWLRGDVVLHAAAVVPPDGGPALAIAGPSGSGKSHLAAALLARGARLVADDSIAVRGTICAGLAGGYHLGGRDDDDDDRPFHPVPGGRCAAPLGTLVIVDEAAGACERLAGVDALRALLANRHRASVPRMCGLEARALPAIARLARKVAVFRASRNAAAALLDGRLGAAMKGERE